MRSLQRSTRFLLSLRRSLTWDQGAEMHNTLTPHRHRPEDLLSCDPHSPLERGSNENTPTGCCAVLPKRY